MAPQLKIEDGDWLLSTDGGKTWDNLGPAKGQDGANGTDGVNGADGKDGQDGKDGDNIFQSVTQDEDTVTFTLVDGTEITLPKGSAGNLKITFSQQNDIPIWFEKEATITYHVTGNNGKPVAFQQYNDSNFELTFTPADNSSGTITIKPIEAPVDLHSTFFFGCDGKPYMVASISYKYDISQNDNVIIYQTTSNSTFEASSKYRDSSYKAEMDGYHLLISKTPVTEIGEDQFAKKSGSYYVSSPLKKIILPHTITSIGNNAFRYTAALTEIDLPETVTSIGSYAFWRSTISQIKIPEGVTSIKYYCFSECKQLTEITLPKSVKEIEYDAFQACTALQSIDLSGVTSIGGGAFYGCSNLQNITLSEELVTIPSQAFYKCSSLSSITLPASLSSIGEGAFQDCTNLNEIYCKRQTPPSVGVTGPSSSGSFKGVNCTVYVPTGSKTAYETKWSKYAGTFTFVEQDF